MAGNLSVRQSRAVFGVGAGAVVYGDYGKALYKRPGKSRIERVQARAFPDQKGIETLSEALRAETSKKGRAPSPIRRGLRLMVTATARAAPMKGARVPRSEGE